MDYKIKRNVLITGATSGIGREIAVVFASKGWNLFCHYHSSGKKIENLNKDVAEHGVDIHRLKADFRSKGDIRRFLSEVKKLDIDSLINNAGTYIAARHFSDLGLDDMRDVFMVNAFAPMMIASAVFARMKEKRFGRIVNISSIAAKYGGSAHSMHYGCSKLALEGMTKTLAREGAPHNILVNTIRPGVIDTEFHKRFPKDMKKRIDMIPMKRMGTPGDVAHLTYYLGSDKNSYITNEAIAVSGGE